MSFVQRVRYYLRCRLCTNVYKVLWIAAGARVMSLTTDSELAVKTEYCTGALRLVEMVVTSIAETWVV